MSNREGLRFGALSDARTVEVEHGDGNYVFAIEAYDTIMEASGSRITSASSLGKMYRCPTEVIEKLWRGECNEVLP